MLRKRFLICALMSALVVAVVLPLQAGAGSTKRAGTVIWGGKNDCGSSTTRGLGYTRSGRAVLQRTGDNMTLSFKVSGLNPNTVYIAEVHDPDDLTCTNFLYGITEATDANGNANNANAVNPFPVGGHSHFFVDFRQYSGIPSSVAEAGTVTVTLQ